MIVGIFMLILIKVRVLSEDSVRLNWILFNYLVIVVIVEVIEYYYFIIIICMVLFLKLNEKFY